MLEKFALESVVRDGISRLFAYLASKGGMVLMTSAPYIPCDPQSLGSTHAPHMHRTRPSANAGTNLKGARGVYIEAMVRRVELSFTSLLNWKSLKRMEYRCDLRSTLFEGVIVIHVLHVQLDLNVHLSEKTVNCAVTKTHPQVAPLPSTLFCVRRISHRPTS